MKKGTGSIALLGGGEWTEPCRGLDSHLLHLAQTDDVLIVPTAAAFEHPERVVERAVAWFEGLGANATGLPVLNRRDAEADAHVAAMRVAKFVYLADGSPLHLRSVLKGSPLFDALTYAHGRGAVIAASGAGATVVCDPMVDPRAVPTRSGSASCPASPCSPTTRARPTTGASARSSCSRPTRCSSGSTSRPRSCARRRGSGR